jgi:hypothetical protein
MLKAFWRVAPSVRFSHLAIFLVGVLLRANALSSRTSFEVQARRFFEFLAITASQDTIIPVSARTSESDSEASSVASD